MHGTKLKEIKIRTFKRNTVFLLNLVASLNLKGSVFFIHTVCVQVLNACHNKFIPNMFYVHGFVFGKFHLLIFIISL
jgi:hypothetical protein